ncbi:phosphate/phosphite/phosphonate ABC transporter substrate-binding protein [Pseudemcibacter aquimaris]|uniref:phosphate/phosphite/phosphonate ABC transporter substrate-binding protein n=1 Tax=Pseudemcibacter aquimaris TaxID=2857064 RepID=UPI0020119D09|nr:PhnD/SsuA/transferrin family substrate-binding protein [Pseudemcibacter aquimaris]MCC3859736.1 PhnD/SsuA/transferrin family substrate-binding protein [Pseudemcibacter aquimaris]WDU60130.1 PhnD/SsuA/transferrin family substrate-binding protein [Pseudemcibacter aquimaris]
MLANLPMYDRPELRDAHEEFWTLIRDNLRTAGVHIPDEMSWDAGEIECWTDPFFYFSQTCGKPYREKLHETVTLIGTPDYGLQGCPPGYYRSAYVVHKTDDRYNLDDHKKSKFAYNDENSQSGYHVTNDYFENKICSGSHINSAKMVANGDAEIAAIDALSLKLIKEYDDFAGDIKVIAWTEPTPGLPYIAYKGADQNAFYSAISTAITALPDETREKLHLNGIVFIPKETYLAVS